MSLIHWWPLNGDTKDYGTGNIALTNSGATVNNSGKIGKCYSFNGSNTMTASGVTIGTNCSFCIWSKTSTTGKMMFGLQASGSNRLNLYNSPEGPICWNTGDAAQNPFKNGDTPITTITDGAWHHYAVVCKGSDKAHLYIDGVYAGTAIKYINPSMNNNLFYVANWSGTSGYQWNGQLNDVRIYDHALSIKEIKEISKGLVLHYNFEEAVRPNLIRGNYQTYSTKDGKTESGSIIYNLPSDLNTLIGKTLVLSYDVKCVGDRKNNTGDYNKDRYCFHGAIQYKATESSSITTVYPFADNLEPRNVEKRVIMYYVVPSTWYSITNLTLANQSYNQPASTNNETWYIKNLKLEVLDNASDLPTPYSTESEENVVYDNSGYGYNGTINGNLTLANDSTIPSGINGMKFASDSYIDIPTLPEFKQLTVSFWTKIPTATGGYRSLFNQKNSPTGSLWLSLNTESYGLWSYMSSSPSYSGAGGYISANTWYFCTFVFDNGYANWYQNGVLSGRNVYYPNKLEISSTHFCLGDSYDGSSWSGTPFDGWIADFKVYATALSAEDIKAEYNRKASIDNTGKLFVSEIIEEDNSNTQITQKGQVITNLFATTMELDDGSLWVPICMHYVPDGLNTSSSQKYSYTSRNIWNNFGAINNFERPENGQYEFYVMQQTAVDGAYSWFRFKQNINPLNATWNDVNPSKVGTNVTRIASSTTNSYAGMYWVGGTSNAPMTFANSSNGNWYGCAIMTAYQGGIPGYNGQVVKGWQMVYMRISKSHARMFKNGLFIPTDIIEN